MRQLAWDDELAKSATTWAETCTWGHDPNNTDGENLYTRYSSVNDNDNIAVLVSGVEDWYNEYVDYDFATNTCQPSPAQCGHYTQNVCSTTTHVGCGYANCEGPTNYPFKILFVCRYNPPGNYAGQQPYMPHPIQIPSRPRVPHRRRGTWRIPTVVCASQRRTQSHP